MERRLAGSITKRRAGERRLSRCGAFLRERRSGHRHSSWPGVPDVPNNNSAPTVGGRFTF